MIRTGPIFVRLIKYIEKFMVWSCRQTFQRPASAGAFWAAFLTFAFIPTIAEKIKEGDTLTALFPEFLIVYLILIPVAFFSTRIML